MIGFARTLVHRICSRKQAMIEISRHMLDRNEDKLIESIKSKGPYFAIEAINTCQMVGYQNCSIVKNAVNLLKKCEGEMFLASHFNSIDKFIQRKYSEDYEKIKKCQIPMKKVFKLPGGGSVTLVCYNTDIEINESYDKLLLDTPTNLSINLEGNMMISNVHLQKEEISTFLKGWFSENLQYIDEKTYIYNPQKLYQQVQLFPKVIQYLEHSPSNPMIVTCFPPFSFKSLFLSDGPVEKLQNNLEMTPFYGIFSIWHFMSKYLKEDCCEFNQPKIEQNSTYLWKMHSFTDNSESLSFENLNMLKSIFHEAQLDKNTLVLLDDMTYNFVAAILTHVNWIDEKQRNRNYSCSESILQEIQRISSQINVEDIEQMKKLIRKNAIIENSHQFFHFGFEEVQKQNQELAKYAKQMKEKYEKSNSFVSVCDQAFLSKYRNMTMDKCPLISYSLNMICSNVKPIGQPKSTDTLFEKIDKLALK